MSIAAGCPACGSGNHDGHDRDWNITPGLIGGSYCDCSGDCAERIKAAGEQISAWLGAPPMTPAVPDPTVEALSEAITAQLACYTLPANYNAPRNGRESHEDVARRCGPLIAERILAAHTTAAPDPLSDRLQALCELGVREQWPPDEWRAGLLAVLAVAGEDA